MSDRLDLSLRGLPEWLIRAYLQEMGAELVGGEAEATAAKAADEGWSVSWTKRRVRIRGSAGLGLTQFDLVFEGEAELLEEVHERFMKKAQRGGG